MDSRNDSLPSASSFPGDIPGCVPVACSVEIFIYACYLMFSCFSACVCMICIYVYGGVCIYIRLKSCRLRCITSCTRHRCQPQGIKNPECIRVDEFTSSHDAMRDVRRCYTRCTVSGGLVLVGIARFSGLQVFSLHTSTPRELASKYLRASRDGRIVVFLVLVRWECLFMDHWRLV